MENVVIVGAGLAGLICATELHARNIPFLLLEGSNEVGGRIRSDLADGFIFDRGFQILLTAYPWVSRYLDLDALDFRPVKSGALVWNGESFQRLVDPIRHPAEVSSALTTPVVTWGDRLRLTALAAKLYPQGAEALLDPKEATTTADYLFQTKFSERAMQSFLRPFFGGVFLEQELATASNYFRFLFRVFGTGAAGLPARGMGEIPRQLAAKLPSSSIRLNAPVAGRNGREVILSSGEKISARALVCAGDQESARALSLAEGPTRPWHHSFTVYFAAKAAPVKENLLALNGLGEGLVNSVLVMSEVSSAYAPAGEALVSVSLRGFWNAGEEANAATGALEELSRWWGPSVKEWRYLRSVAVPHALPAYPPGMDPFGTNETREEGVFLAGDLLTIPSQEGAASSGRSAAEAVASYLRGRQAGAMPR